MEKEAKTTKSINKTLKPKWDFDFEILTTKWNGGATLVRGLHSGVWVFIYIESGLHSDTWVFIYIEKHWVFVVYRRELQVRTKKREREREDENKRKKKRKENIKLFKPRVIS